MGLPPFAQQGDTLAPSGVKSRAPGKRGASAAAAKARRAETTFHRQAVCSRIECRPASRQRTRRQPERQCCGNASWKRRQKRTCCLGNHVDRDARARANRPPLRGRRARTRVNVHRWRPSIRSPHSPQYSRAHDANSTPAPCAGPATPRSGLRGKRACRIAATGRLATAGTAALALSPASLYSNRPKRSTLL